jgi:hypothetical protein
MGRGPFPPARVRGLIRPDNEREIGLARLVEFQPGERVDF